jgi:hypothetical protein
MMPVRIAKASASTGAIFSSQADLFLENRRVPAEVQLKGVKLKVIGGSAKLVRQQLTLILANTNPYILENPNAISDLAPCSNTVNGYFQTHGYGKPMTSTALRAIWFPTVDIVGASARIRMSLRT